MLHHGSDRPTRRNPRGIWYSAQCPRIEAPRHPHVAAANTHARVKVLVTDCGILRKSFRRSADLREECLLGDRLELVYLRHRSARSVLLGSGERPPSAKNNIKPCERFSQKPFFQIPHLYARSRRRQVRSMSRGRQRRRSRNERLIGAGLVCRQHSIDGIKGSGRKRRAR